MLTTLRNMRVLLFADGPNDFVNVGVVQDFVQPDTGASPKATTMIREPGRQAIAGTEESNGG